MARKKRISMTEERYQLEHETLILMADYIYAEVYGMENVWDYNQAVRLVRDAALRFEKKWNEELSKKEDADYIIELESFGDEELERLHKEYD